MGLHAQAFAAMPLRPAQSEIISDLLDEERTLYSELISADYSTSSEKLGEGETNQTTLPQGSGTPLGASRRSF